MLDFLRDGKEITDFKNEQEKKLYFAELEYWCIKSEWKTIQELQKVFWEEPSEAHPKALEKWRELGPFDVEKEIKKKKLILDIHKEINIDGTEEKKSKGG